MGLWDVLRGQSQAAQGQPRRPVRAARRRPSRSRPRWACTPTGVGSVCFRAAEGRGLRRRPSRRRRDLRRRRRRPARREPGRRVRLHLAARPAPTRPTSRALVTDLHAVNTSLEVQGFGPGCSARLVGFRDRRGRTRRPRLPLQAGHVLPVRPDRAEQPRQRCWSSRSATPLGGDLPIEQDTSPLDADLGDPPGL